MANPIIKVVELLNGAPMQTSVNTVGIDSVGYLSGMLLAYWTGNDAFDGTIFLQGSADNTHWNNMGLVIDDVGSVTINTANDNQQWSFGGEGFPFRFFRMAYNAGSNTAGSLSIAFTGYERGPS